MDVRRFLKSSSFLLTQRVISALLGFLLPLYLTNIVSSATLGEYFLYVSLQNVLGLIGVFGMGAALITHLNRHAEKREIFLGSGLVISGVVTGLVVVLTFLFRTRINTYIGADIWPLLPIGLSLLVAANIFSTVLIGENRIPTNAFTSFVGQAITIPCQLAVAEYGFFAIAAAYNIQFVIVLLSTFFLRNTRIRIPDTESIVTMVSYGSKAIISNVEERAFKWADLFVIGLVLPSSAVGVYGVIWIVSSVAFLPTKTIGTSLLPEVSQSDGYSSSSDFSRMLSLAVFASIAFILPIFGGSVFVGRSLLDVLFGVEYAEAWLVLVVALAGRMFHALHRISRNGLLALNQAEITSRVGVISIGLNVGFNLVLVPRFGLIGAAIATSLAIALSSVPLIYYFTRSSSSSILPTGSILNAAASTIVMSGLVYVVTRLVDISSAIRLFGMIVLGALVYFALLISIDEDAKTAKQYMAKYIRAQV